MLFLTCGAFIDVFMHVSKDGVLDCREHCGWLVEEVGLHLGLQQQWCQGLELQVA
jgi:hypothetical protein